MGKAFVKKRYDFTKEGILHFYRNRIMRIVPLAFSALLIILVFIYPEKIRNLHDFMQFWRIIFFPF